MYSGTRDRRCDRTSASSNAPPRNHVRDELRARAVVPRDDDGFLDARVLDEPRLDLAELDAVAAYLDLVVEAAEELQRAIGAAADEIAGPIQAPLAERILNEALGRQLGSLPVAADDALAADVQLAGEADWREAAVLVEDVQRRVGDGEADRDVGSIARQVRAWTTRPSSRSVRRRSSRRRRPSRRGRAPGSPAALRRRPASAAAARARVARPRRAAPSAPSSACTGSA